MLISFPVLFLAFTDFSAHFSHRLLVFTLFLCFLAALSVFQGSYLRGPSLSGFLTISVRPRTKGLGIQCAEK